MGQHQHKATNEEKKPRAKRSKESDGKVDHPVLQLQQKVGNKAVTSLIQRHPEQDSKIESVYGAYKNLWGDHLLTSQSLKWAHEKTNTNKSSIGVLFGKVNQLSQSSGGGGGGSGDIYEP